MAISDRERLEDQPPSAKLVYRVLDYNDGPMTQKDIVEESMLSARTARYALEQLKESRIVEERIYLADARQSLYELTEQAETAERASSAGPTACDD